jgi:hypothetical protein
VPLSLFPNPCAPALSAFFVAHPPRPPKTATSAPPPSPFLPRCEFPLHARALYLRAARTTTESANPSTRIVESVIAATEKWVDKVVVWCGRKKNREEIWREEAGSPHSLALATFPFAHQPNGWYHARDSLVPSSRALPGFHATRYVRARGYRCYNCANNLVSRET